MLDKEKLKKQIEEIKNNFKEISRNNSKTFIKKIQEKKKMIDDLYDPMIKATKENYEKIKEEKDNYIKELEEIEKQIKGEL